MKTSPTIEQIEKQMEKLSDLKLALFTLFNLQFLDHVDMIQDFIGGDPILDFEVIAKLGWRVTTKKYEVRIGSQDWVTIVGVSIFDRATKKLLASTQSQETPMQKLLREIILVCEQKAKAN
jgi:hypothetical protein